MKEKLNKFLDKIKESAKKVGKKLKKGEVGLYAIALMLVAAGYYNYTTFKPETAETYSEDIANINHENTNVDAEHTNIGDAVLVSNNEDVTEEEPTTEEETNIEENKTEADKNLQENKNVEGKDVLNVTNETSVEPSDDNSYYVNTKLERDQMYAEMITNYENILNNSNASEVQKSIATEEISKINTTKNAIMICENLIMTKGFENCVILINEASVNVMVSIEGGLTTEHVAKIQNIISRELNTNVEDIHITEI